MSRRTTTTKTEPRSSRAKTLTKTPKANGQVCVRQGRNAGSFSGRPSSQYTVCLTENQKRVLGSLDKRLGCGTIACAYTAPENDKVVKLTRDAEDVAALQLANEAKIPWAVKLHAAYRLKGGGIEQGGKRIPVYAMVVDRVKPVPETDEDRVSDWMNITDDVAAAIRANGDQRLSTYDLEPYRREACGKEFGARRAQCREVVADYNDAYAAFKKIGIDWSDAHAGNIGYKGDSPNFVVIDLGLSAKNKKPQAELLAGMKKRLLNRALKGTIK